VDVAVPQQTAFQVTELVEQKQRVVAGAAELAQQTALEEREDFRREVEEAEVTGRIISRLHKPATGRPRYRYFAA
jgi:response regulator of citrate/malate metabolism